ncbi:hypothetical protein NE237_021399 [Protea cynaroides]|uniref:non-specific serine/threonine protein kinase n=1 Tax=Protea cynaroides TaxID=273540 RepID=A0A9Q0K2K0_9MAGN|nr:hypothetical protein NE237_021399 [Protea cynaroides]
MPGDSSSEHEPDDDSAFVEIDPSGRYGRYDDVLGKGAFKTVYRGFDESEGIEVAWNQIRVADFLQNSEDLERLYSEVLLLKTLKHKNIIKFYNSWVDKKHKNINFITEIFTSGTLRQYRKKHKRVDLRALKNWSRQILAGLLYLHSHDPPVIHRDLKCDNIFVNGNQGVVKIGDLGLAAILRQARSAHSVIGTPEFMAPELYEEEYNELVDIYAFGMCLLELVTFEYPYAECNNAAQIFKKVTSGIKPASLAKVKDPRVRQFIEKCIANVSERLPASELLMDPFLLSDEENEIVVRSLPDTPSLSVVEDETTEASRDFMVKSQRKDFNTIFVKLGIADSTGHVRQIHFPFDIEMDTAISVAREMVQELDLTDQDVTTIAEMIDADIRAHIPEWTPKETSGDNLYGEVAISDTYESENKDELSPLTVGSGLSLGGLVLERFSSGRKYWSNSPKGLSGSPQIRPSLSNFSQINLNSNDDLGEDLEDLPCKDKSEGDHPNGIASLKQQEQTSLVNSGTEYEVETEQYNEFSSDEIIGENRGADATVVSHLSDNQNGGSGSACLLVENCEELMEVKSDDVKVVLKKLEHLLVMQQKELDELRRKHDLQISNIVRELPPETRDRVLSIYQSKISNFKVHNDSMRHELDNSVNATISNNVIEQDKVRSMSERSNNVHIIGRGRKQESLSKDANGKVSRDRFNMLRENTRSLDTGIAVILGDDSTSWVRRRSHAFD